MILPPMVNGPLLSLPVRQPNHPNGAQIVQISEEALCHMIQEATVRAVQEVVARYVTAQALIDRP